MTVLKPYMIRGPLTAEIAEIRSPVRQFLSERCTSEAARPATPLPPGRPAADCPCAPEAANPGTVGTAGAPRSPCGVRRQAVIYRLLRTCQFHPAPHVVADMAPLSETGISVIRPGPITPW
jgi:hypothetical protein